MKPGRLSRRHVKQRIGEFLPHDNGKVSTPVVGGESLSGQVYHVRLIF
jgi:hypothetical protein